MRRSPDYLLLGSTIALLVLGAIMVYSASFIVAHNEFADDAYFLTRQLVWIGIGAISLVLGLGVSYRRWRSLSLLIMIGCLALLVLVLVPGIGARSYGAVRWIRLGSLVQVEPSELAKLGVVIYLADWLARRGSVVRRIRLGLVPFAILVGIVAGLVLVQPDLGTTSIIVATAICVYFVAGANPAHLLVMAGGAAAGGLLLVGRLTGYRQDRIAAFLDPWSDIQGSGWHTAQGLIALGSGGAFGHGLGNGLQKAYWVPNAHTDAIFAIIGEELGFFGCIGVLLLFGVLAWRGFVIAWRAPDGFGRLLAAGLTCMLTSQALVNIAVVTNSVPYTGITLPLVSFGGSSTVISLFAIGVLLNISRYRDTLAVEEEQRQSDQPPEPQAHARRPYALIERRQPAKVRRTFATRSRQVQPVRARAIARVRHG